MKLILLNEHGLIFPPSGTYKNIKVEKVGEKKNVTLIQLNRPKALNALCDGLIKDLNQALDEVEADSTVGAVVLTGSERAFAGLLV